MNQENITRTFSTGQSDITRHEAYTKVQGLNWANASAPKYVAADKFNGHEYVDLGLPSGTLWATMNVGAKSETDPGLYFAWGEIQGYTAEQVGVDKQFTWADYKFNPSGDGKTFTKYTSHEETLELIDDAAAVNMGGNWHMPSEAQILELLACTTHGFIDTTGQFIRFGKDPSGPAYGGGGDPVDSTTAFEGTAGYIFFEEDKSLSESISSGKYIFIPNNSSAFNGSIVASPKVEHEINLYSNHADTDFSDCFSFRIAKDDNFTLRESGYFEHFCPRFVGNPVRGVIGQLESQGGGEGGNRGGTSR